MIQENTIYFEGLSRGDRVGKRYLLEQRLGVGGFGEVWRAVDLRTENEVALKLVPERVVAQSGWHESFLLRHLDLPGVASLLDEGRDLVLGAAYFAMELARGVPFPGASGLVNWKVLLPRAIALARTLGHVHDQAIVHQDLKPENVLVDLTCEQVTVLDFGLSRQLLDAQSEGISGTLGYISPEQLRRQPTSPRTDIYALGVMCYEALCGELPRRGETFRQHLRALLTKPVMPLSARGVAIPEALDALILRMLHVDPAQRPSSMREVVQQMSALCSGESVNEAIRQRVEGVRFLEAGFGSRLSALDEGQPWALRVTALHQESDTLTLIALLAQERPDWRVERTPRGRHPFESLTRVLGTQTSEQGSHDLTTWRAMLTRQLEALLQHTCLVSEQREVDRWSWALLQKVGGRQIQLHRDRSVPTACFAEHDLMELFSGIELWLELRSRAARALYAQTGGELFKVWRTLQVWRKLGLIGELEHQGKFVLDEGNCLRIEAGEQGAWEGGPQLEEAALADPVCLELLTWIMVSKGLATVEHCVVHVGQPRWVIESWIEELEALGFVTRSESGLLWTEPLYSPLDVWSSAQLRTNHLAIARALDTYEPRRLTHLILAGEHDQVLAEASHVARTLESRGRVLDAFKVLKDACGLAKHRARGEVMQGLTSTWASMAMLSENLDHVDDFLAISRGYEVDAMVLELVTLLRSQMRGADNAFELEYLMHHMPERMAEPWLEVCRLQVGYRACRGQPDLAERFLSEHESWFRCQEPDIECVYDEWYGILLGQRGEFVASATKHEQVTDRREALGRYFEMASSAYNATTMWFNALEYERARDCLAKIRPHIVPWQGGYMIRLRQFERHVAALMGEPLALEPEIDRVVTYIGQSYFEAMVYATETSIAWRLGAREEAVRYARRLARGWRNFGWLPGELLGIAMQAHLGEELERDVDLLIAQIEQVQWPRLVVQSCGLLCSAVDERHKETLRHLVTQRLRDIPSEVYEKRLELLSVQEACVLAGIEL